MKTNTRLYVDIHVLQTVPPSCVNRDDTGSPKTAVYGGVNRARVSSQSWKRAMRLTFPELFNDEEQLGVRTKRIVRLVADEIKRIAPDTPEPEKLAIKAFTAANLKIKDEDKGTDALFFISMAQVRALAKLAVEEDELAKSAPSKEVKAKAIAALREHPGIDIALFGRMVADDASLNTDACAQVAHSISTHKVSNEYDYFTAVDDMSPKENAGAAHLGTVEFNSATLYRYATVAVHQLEKQLGGDTAKSVKNFVNAFVRSMPDGKQNTFANRTLPDAVLVTVRNDQSVNLVGAFERPVKAGDEGYIAQSAKRFVDYAKTVYTDYAGEPEVSFVTGSAFSELAQPRAFTVLLEELESAIQTRIESDGADE